MTQGAGSPKLLQNLAVSVGVYHTKNNRNARAHHIKDIAQSPNSALTSSLIQHLIHHFIKLILKLFYPVSLLANQLLIPLNGAP